MIKPSFAVLLTVLTLGATPVVRAQEVWTTGAYAYDGAGNIVQIGSDRYLYDQTGRLASAIVSGTSETYHYDSFANLTGIDRSGQPLPFPAISPQTNRFMGEQYDAAGNMATNGSSSYVWDALNMMAELNTTAGVKKRFIYTADDERIGVIASSSLSRWTIRDFDGKVLREFRADGANAWTWEEDYAYSEGKLLGAERPPVTGGVRHFHLDHLGTPRLITNASAQKLGRHDYYPFGVEQTAFNQEVTQHNQDRPEPMRFTGHQRDFHGDLFTDNTDYLDYMHARYYSAVVGRFLSVDREAGDPVDPQSWNRYVYSGNSPLRYIDPDGNKKTVFERLAQVTASAGEAIKARGAALNNGSVLGTAVDATMGTVGDLVGGSGDMLNVGVATGEAIGAGADTHDLLMAASQDTGRASAIILTLAAGGQAAHARMSTTAMHFTDDAGRAAILRSGSLREGTFVTRPSQVQGMTATPVEQRLTIAQGRGQYSVTTKVQNRDLRVPANGTKTDGGAWQRQTTKPCAVDNQCIRLTPNG